MALLHVDLQDEVSTAQQQQGLQANGVWVALPLLQGAQTLLSHPPQLLGALVQLLKEPQAFSGLGIRRLWVWGGSTVTL